MQANKCTHFRCLIYAGYIFTGWFTFQAYSSYLYSFLTDSRVSQIDSISHLIAAIKANKMNILVSNGSSTENIFRMAPVGSDMYIIGGYLNKKTG